MGRKKMTEERRKQIYIGLFHAVVKKGLLKCTITDISQEAKLSRGILHYYFKSKQEMLIELMKSLGETHFKELQRIIAGADDVGEKLNRIVQFQYLDDSKPFHDTASVWVEFWGLAAHDREIREVVRTIQARLRTFIAELIVEGMEKGEFRKVEPTPAASVIMSMLEGPTLQWCVDHRALNIKEVSKALEDFIFCYLKSPGSNGSESKQEPRP